MISLSETQGIEKAPDTSSRLSNNEQQISECHTTQSTVSKVDKKLRYFSHVRDNFTKRRRGISEDTKPTVLLTVTDTTNQVIKSHLIICI